MFSSRAHAYDCTDLCLGGRLFIAPFAGYVTALIPSAGVQNHAPQLCWVRDDLLACVWMSGCLEGTSSMSIMLSILSSDSNSWSPSQLISQDAERSEQNPLLFVSRDRLFLIHTAQHSRNRNNWDVNSGSSFSMQWTARLRIQSISIADVVSCSPKTWGSEAWSESSELLDQSSFCRNPPHQRSDGCWLLPIYRSLEEGGAFGHDHSQLLVLAHSSDDSLVNCGLADVPESTGRVHGSIVVSSDGLELLQFFRSRLADYIYCSKADLSGEIWTHPVPTTLPNNNSSINCIRLLSGRLAIIYNRFGFTPDPLNPQEWGEANWPRTRWPLSIALSEDDGVTWPWIRDIDTGFGFCGTGNWTLNGQLAYPSLLEGKAGELHIAYSWAGRTAIRYVCLQEYDIIGFVQE